MRLPLAPPSCRSDRVLVSLLAIALAVFLSVGGAVTVRRGIRGSSELREFVAITRAAMVEPAEYGDLLYEHPHYRFYPPFFWCVYAPVAVFPGAWGRDVRHGLGAGLLFLMQSAAMALAVGCVVWGVWPAGRAVPRRFAAAVWLVMIPLFFNAMVRCEPDLLVLAPLAAGCLLLSRGRGFLGGFLVGLAAALKLTPGLFLLYFLYRRKWRAVAGMAAAGIVAVAVVPTLFWGPRGNYRQHVSFVRRVLVPHFTVGADRMFGGPYRPSNQSLTAVTVRALADDVRIGGKKHGPLLRVGGLTKAAAKRVALAAQILLLAGMAWAIGRRRESGHPLVPWLEYSLVVIGMLELSFVSWASHHVVLLLPVAALGAFVMQEPSSRERRVVAGGLGVWLVLLAAARWKGLSLLFFSTMTLFFLSAWLLVRLRRPAAGGAALESGV